MSDFVYLLSNISATEDEIKKKKNLQINDYRKGDTLILFLRQQLIYLEQYSAVL